MQGIKQSGIYCIRNIHNHKLYVGSSVNLHKRWLDHRKLLRKGSHHSRKLQNAWEKWGEDSFVFDILEYVVDVAELTDVEQMYMDFYDACSETGYNILPRAHSPLGAKRSEETRRRIGASKRGTTHSEESRRRMSESQKKYYEENPERRLKQAEDSTGRVCSDETRKKLSDAHKGKKKAPFSEQAKRNMAAARRRHQHSPETKAKMAEARREYWRRKKAEKDCSTIEPTTT
jgi:group I intron endonuclease